MPPKSTAPRKPASPTVGRHKAKNLAYIRIAGRMIYTGPWDAPESHAKAHALLAEAAANGGTLPPPRHAGTVAEIARAYLLHCKEYYAATQGDPQVNTALFPVVALFGHLDAADFGPLKLSAIRQLWITGGTVGGKEIPALCRSTINAHIQRVVRCFRWAASRELVHPDVPAALCMLEGLRKGRSKAREPRIVRAVPDAHVEATLPFLPRPVAGLVRLHRACGARSSELLGLRLRDIDRSGRVWLLRLTEHKNAGRGKDRTLCFGPKAQAVILEYARGKAPWAVIFSPRDAIAERSEKATVHRRPNQKPDPRKTERTIAEAYTKDSYGRAVARGVEKANEARRKEGLPEIPRWHPHQLRHAAGTEIRQHHGLDAVSASLGHSDPKTSAIYAELSLGKAVAVAAELG